MPEGRVKRRKTCFWIYDPFTPGSPKDWWLMLRTLRQVTVGFGTIGGFSGWHALTGVNMERKEGAEEDLVQVEGKYRRKCAEVERQHVLIFA